MNDTIENHLKFLAEFCNFTEEDRNALKESLSILGPVLTDLLDALYAHLFQFKEVQDIFSSPEESEYIQDRKKALGAWIVSLASDDLNKISKRLISVAKIHTSASGDPKRSVPPKYFVMTTSFLQTNITQTLHSKIDGDFNKLNNTIHAWNKILFIQLEVFLKTVFPYYPNWENSNNKSGGIFQGIFSYSTEESAKQNHMAFLKKFSLFTNDDHKIIVGSEPYITEGLPHLGKMLYLHLLEFEEIKQAITSKDNSDSKWVASFTKHAQGWISNIVNNKYEKMYSFAINISKIHQKSSSGVPLKFFVVASSFLQTSIFLQLVNKIGDNPNKLIAASNAWNKLIMMQLEILLKTIVPTCSSWAGNRAQQKEINMATDTVNQTAPGRNLQKEFVSGYSKIMCGLFEGNLQGITNKSAALTNTLLGCDTCAIAISKCNTLFLSNNTKVDLDTDLVQNLWSALQDDKVLQSNQVPKSSEIFKDCPIGDKFKVLPLKMGDVQLGALLLPNSKDLSLENVATVQRVISQALSNFFVKQTLEDRLVNLKQKIDEKENFLASSTHELRTLLNGLISYFSLGLKKAKKSLQPQDLKYFFNANQTAQSLLQLVNNLLDFSKLSAGKIEVNLEQVSIYEVIEESLSMTGGMIEGRGISIKSEMPPGLPSIDSDYNMLKLIFNNLISNAAKFTKEGYIKVEAKQQDETSITVFVEDTGCGIAQEALPNIFESFKQVQGTGFVKKRFGGTGLGLAITKGFCDNLHIHIDVETEVDKGTTFILKIPISQTS